jgi:DNA-binding NarL/FixJ family response regulator
MSVKIILADDHKIMRQGLHNLLEKQADFEIVEEADDGITAVKKTKELSPDVVIMDVSMPGLNGIEATRQIKAEMPEVKVIALSMHAEKRFVAEMLNAGASAYLLKDSAFEELVRAIRAALVNKIYLNPSIAETVIKDYIKQVPRESFSAFSILSKREREVLQLLAEGSSTKEIASLLFLSIKTVETHRKNIMEKLDLHSIAELTKYAIREGITSLDS